MAINIRSSQDSMLEQMTSLTFRGFPDSALGVLEKTGLNEIQKNKIETIITQPHGDYTLQAAEKMKQSMIAVIRGEDIQPAASNKQPSSSQAAQIPTFELYPDIMGILFRACVSQCDIRTIAALPCVNKYWNQITIDFFAGCDLKQICPELTIMDAKTQQRECDDEPKIDKFQIFKAVKKVAQHVEGNAGVTLLTMIKGDTLNKLIEIAAQEGMQVIVSSNVIIEELGDVPIKQTYVTLITNNVFMDSRNKNYKSQEGIVEGHGCVMPVAQEYVKLSVFTQKIFKKCLYSETPPTYGRSSTYVQGYPLVVGGSAPGRLFVLSHDYFVDEHRGAGGQRKF